MAVLGTSMGDVLDGTREPAKVRAREAIVGAMAYLPPIQPGLNEIAALLGKKHHAAVHGMLRRYDREWPGAIRELWESSVWLQLGASQPGGPAPGARARPMDRVGRYRGRG